MTISQADLPHDDSGILPAGMWRAVLRDPLTDGFAQMAFEQGVSAPMTGRSLWRLVIAMPVIGAMRIEGDACEIGDCSRLKPQTFTVKVPDKVFQETVATVTAATKAVVEPLASTVVTSEQTGAKISTWRELVAMSEDKVRALATELGNDDLRARVGKLRRFIADELGIEVEQ
jgi:hypothetical protein